MSPLAIATALLSGAGSRGRERNRGLDLRLWRPPCAMRQLPFSNAIESLLGNDKVSHVLCVQRIGDIQASHTDLSSENTHQRGKSFLEWQPLTLLWRKGKPLFYCLRQLI